MFYKHIVIPQHNIVCVCGGGGGGGGGEDFGEYVVYIAKHKNCVYCKVSGL